jgi:hypothetical protein
LTEALGTFGQNNSDYIERVVNVTFAAVDQTADIKLRVSVLKVASPPLVKVRKEVPGAAAADSESSQTDTATRKHDGFADEVTSASPDAQPEGL